MNEVDFPEIVEEEESREGFFNEHGLKQALDSIDQAIINNAQPKIYECQFLSITGQWVKGKVIFDHMTGQSEKQDCPPSWRELERKTGRSHHSLKKWHELYLDHSNEEEFKEWAQAMANDRALKWGTGIEALSGEEKEEEEKPTDMGLEWLKCLAKRYSGTDPVWRQACAGCLTRGLCGDITGLVEKEVIRVQKEREE